MFVLLQILRYENIRNESEKPAYFFLNHLSTKVLMVPYFQDPRVFLSAASVPNPNAGPLRIVSLLGPATQSLDHFQGAVCFPWKQICCLTQYYSHAHIINYHYSQYLTPHYFKYSFDQQKMV